MVAGACNGIAFRVAEYYNYFGANHLCGKLHTAQNIGIQYVTSNSYSLNIAQALVKYQLGRCAAINTAEYSGKGELPASRFVYLL